MKALLILSALLSFQIFAETCKVENAQDALECIKKDGYQRYGEGDVAHSVGVTDLAQGREAFELLTGKVSTADYVGVVEVHYDEDQILYYEINKGESVEPVMVKEYSIADVDYYVPSLENMDAKERLSVLALRLPLVDSMEDFH